MKKYLIHIALLIALFHIYQSHAQNNQRPQLLKDVEILSAPNMQGRKTGTVGNAIAREYIITRFEEIGLQELSENYKAGFSFKERNKTLEGVNIIGMIPGRTSGQLIITAHYDHIGIIDGKVYHGADDNASGVAALLYLANWYKHHKPEHHIIFLVTDAEEMGLQGAKAFLNNLPEGVSRDQIILNINMDMLSRSKSSELYVAGTHHYPELLPLVLQVKQESKVNLLVGHDYDSFWHQDWTYSSDHGPFHLQKIPFLYFGVEDHPDYHKPGDTFDKINTEFYINAVDAIKSIISLADETLKKETK